ncbi:MAG TPA: phosphatidate cytidylyltransferase [Terriglobia bacterium]|nr:phosphatidate cytidylyltransferase [Terriglobia bacterium]
MKRVLTAIAGIPIAIGVTLYAPDGWFAAFVGILASIAFDELLALGAARGGRRASRIITPLAGAVAASFVWEEGSVLLVLAVALLIVMTTIAFAEPLEFSLPRISLAAFGLLYCGVLPGLLVGLVVQAPMGRLLVLVLLGIVFAGDTAAYYGGRALGRHPLAPMLSPKKTVEGALAGLAGSIAAGVILGHWLLGGVPDSAWMAFISLVAAIAGQSGDLAESALKRSAGVKDSSSLLPGHGGMLDRIDSLLFAAPVFYWFFKV